MDLVGDCDQTFENFLTIEPTEVIRFFVGHVPVQSGGYTFLDFTVQKFSNGSVMRLEDRDQPMTPGDPAVILSLVTELGKQNLFESWIESAVTLQGVLTLQITVGIRFDMNSRSMEVKVCAFEQECILQCWNVRS